MRTLLIYIIISIILTIINTSCSLVMAPLPDDFPVLVDTTALPIQDTCESYEEINSPTFVSFHLNTDLPLLDTVYYYQPFPSAPVTILDHETFFDTIFYSGINIAGIKSGTSTATELNGKIWVEYETLSFDKPLLPLDLCGTSNRARHLLNFSSQALHFRGAVTHFQFMDLIEEYPSCQTLRLSNSGYSCTQIIEILNWWLEQCIETPNLIDLRPVSIGSCVIPQEMIDECVSRGSTVLQ